MPSDTICTSCKQPCDLIKYKTQDWDYTYHYIIRSKCCNDCVENNRGEIYTQSQLSSLYIYQQSFEVSEDDLLQR